MARTRTQNQTAAAAAARDATIERIQQRQKPARVAKAQEKASRRSSKVQFSEVVHVKSIPAKEDVRGSTSSGGAFGTCASPGADPRQPRNVLRSQQKAKVHTIANLPASPGEEASTSRPEDSVVGYSRPGRSNIHTLTDLPRIAYDADAQESPVRPKAPPTSIRPPRPAPLAEERRDSIGRRSSLLTTPSPRTVLSRKRARIDESNFYNPPAKRPMFQYEAMADLRDGLRKTPRPLSPEEISALFEVLRREHRDFAFENFAFELSPEAREAWPLHDMDEAYYPLMLAAQFISDGSQYGWRQFFTTPDSRASLVYGVVSHYLHHHVFSVPAFGFRAEDAEYVERVDTEYLYHDSHVRARHRADAIRDVLENSDWRRSSQEAVDSLADDLLTVLTPILPPVIFNYSKETGKFELRHTETAKRHREAVRKSLSECIQLAVNLHYSLRLTGRDGSVVRFCNGLNKGDKWFGDHGAPQNCINKDMIRRTQYHGWLDDLASGRSDPLHFASTGVAENADDVSRPRRPRVRMVCFPRIEMVVPRGPDMEQLGDLQDAYQGTKNHLQESHFTAPEGGDPDDSGDDRRDEGQSSSPTSSRRSSTLSGGFINDDKDAMDWDGAQQWFADGNQHLIEGMENKDEVWERAPPMVQHQYEEKHGKWDAEKNGDLRLAYMLHYQWISNNDVYLEHDYVEPTQKAFVEQYFHEHSEPIKEPITAAETMRVTRDAHGLPREDRDAIRAAKKAAGSEDEDTMTDNDDASFISAPDANETKYTWGPGHSRETALAAYDAHIKYLRGQFLARRNKKMDWRYGNPLPAEERKSLKEAIAEARTVVTGRSKKEKLKFAARDATRSVWNAIAGRPATVEWSAVTVTLTMSLLWLYRWKRNGPQKVTDDEVVRWVEAKLKSFGEKLGGWGQAVEKWANEDGKEVQEVILEVISEVMRTQPTHQLPTVTVTPLRTPTVVFTG